VPEPPSPGGDDREALVAPRFLAGAHCDTDAPLDLLIKRRQWPHHDFEEDGSLFISSPCHRIRVAFRGDYLQPWQIAASEEAMEAPSWLADFGGSTPPEIVEAFVETLADNLDNTPERVFASPNRYVETAIAPLRQAGWEVRFTGTHTTVTEPSGLAGLNIKQFPGPRSEEIDALDTTFTIWAGPRDGDHDARWEARFTRDTPLQLVAAATRSLITGKPVMRYPADIPRDCLPYVTVLPTPAPLDLGRADAARATTRTGPIASAPATTATSTAPHSTTTPARTR